jgi:glycosyltransferase involved in cell wall biosynthesis
MKIVHCFFSFTSGGAENLVTDLANIQVKTNKIYLVIVNAFFDISMFKHLNEKISIVLINRKPRSMDIMPILKLNYIIWKIRPSIIHCHDSHLTKLIFYPIKRKFLTIHKLDDDSIYIKRYRKVFAVSNAVMDYYKNRLNLTSTTISNGICIQNIKVRTNFNFNSTDKFKIIQIGRLDHKIKGQDVLIDAAKKLYENGKRNFTIDFLGDGSSLDFLINMVKEKNLTKHINFLGNIERHELYSKLKDYHLLIQPSISEGFGLTITEAFAAKVPVLVSDIEGPLEVIDYGKCGYIFNNKDSNSLFLELDRIMNNYNSVQMRQIIEAGFDRVCHFYSIEKTVESYMLNYK